MADSPSPQTCPECGNSLVPGAAHGLCARCLLAGAAQPSQPTISRLGATTPEQVAAVFPQLQVLELIGQGGMGAVFKVRQPKLDRFAALKLLPQSLAADSAFAGRFEREARLLAKLSHPNIVSVYDYGQAGDFFYLLMEYIDGVNLRQAMRASRFDAQQALGIVPKICDALQYAHDEGVLHRDIKPENILLDARGRVKLVDFGIAKLAAESEILSSTSHESGPAYTQAGALLGTPSYMAPEQRDHPSDVDHRADIYSLGVVFYELLTGELPTASIARPSEKSSADPRVDAIVQQALEKERERRQGSAGEVRTQVQSVADSWAPSKDSPAAPRRRSKLAIIGALWVGACILGCAASASRDVSAFHRLLFILLLPGLLAPVGTTVFGWMALNDIRRSRGRLGGLDLAVFDALVFPLLLMDCLIVLGWQRAYSASGLTDFRHGGGIWGILWGLSNGSFIAFDYFVIRYVTRWGKGPPVRPPAVRSAEAPLRERRPYFSRVAIIGACWSPFLFIDFVLMPTAAPHPPNLGQRLLASMVLLPLGALAPFGTTILGWIAVTQIRRSRGRLYGLGLAVFDGLLYPLLALDMFIGWAWSLLIQAAFPEFIGGSIVSTSGVGEVSLHSIALILTLLTAAVLDGLIIFWVWRRVREPGNDRDSATSAAVSAPPEGARQTTRLSKTAIAVQVAFVGTAIGVLALMRSPSQPRWLVALVLIAALLTICLSIAAVRKRGGKMSIFFGCFQATILIVASAIFYNGTSFAAVPTEVRYRAFLVDAALVDQLIPPSARASEHVDGASLAPPGSLPSSAVQTASIDAPTLFSLLHGMSPRPGLMIDRSYNAKWPQSADSWTFPGSGATASGTGFIGVRPLPGSDANALELRVHYVLTCADDSRVPGPVQAEIYYDGEAPAAGFSRTFLIPINRSDTSQKYLLVTFNISNLHAAEEPPTPVTTAAVMRGNFKVYLACLGQVEASNNPSPVKPGESMVVRFAVPEDDVQPIIKKRDAGQPVFADAYSRDMKVKLAQGRLTGVDNRIDPQTGTLACKAEMLSIGDSLLFANQFLNVRLLMETRHDVITVPTMAIQHNPNDEFVFVMQPDQSVIARKVTVGKTNDTNTEITDGLTPGESVVIDGAQRIYSGIKVKPTAIQISQP